LRISLQWYVCPNKFATHGLLWTDAANLLMFTIVAAVFATHGLGLRTCPRPNAKSIKVSSGQ
jgi:hypothetical protein